MMTLLLFTLLACSPKHAASDDSATTDGGGVADGGSVGDGGGQAELHGTTPAKALPAPAFAALNRDGSARSREDLLGHPTVIWFYPRLPRPVERSRVAGTATSRISSTSWACTSWASSFDTPKANEAWAEIEGFSFELWSDSDKTLALYYGAASSPTTRNASRVTKVLDAEGNLVLEYQVSAIGTHPKKSWTTAPCCSGHSCSGHDCSGHDCSGHGCSGHGCSGHGCSGHGAETPGTRPPP